MTVTCHQPSIEAQWDLIAAETRKLADVARKTDLDARCPTCPDWSLADLVDHLGSVHRWVEHQVRILTPVRVPGKEVDLKQPGDRSAWADWLEDGCDVLLAALKHADPDAPMWAWGADQHARFWSRRMVHETLVHRTDADFAAGIEPVVDPTVAIDGVDEFLDNLLCAKYFAPNVEKLRGDAVLALRSPNALWSIHLNADGFTWDHDAAEAQATVSGSAADLNLFAWGRRKLDGPHLTAKGDRALLDFWIENSRI